MRVITHSTGLQSLYLQAYWQSRSQTVQCFINPPTLAQSILARNPYGLGLPNGYQNTRFKKVANKSRILFARCTVMNYVRQSRGQVEASKLDLLTFRSALYSLIDSPSHIVIPLQRVCSLMRLAVRNVNFDSIKYTYNHQQSRLVCSNTNMSYSLSLDKTQHTNLFLLKVLTNKPLYGSTLTTYS